MRGVTTLILGAALAVPATAVAQTPIPPAAPPVRPPAKAALQLSVRSADPAAILAGERWVVRGTLRPYVAGQRVTLRFTRHGRKFLVRALAVQRAGTFGRFQLGVTASGAGRITVAASHRRTAEQDTAVAPAVHVSVLALHAAQGSRGPAVRVLQRRLTRLGYVVGRRGLYDARTARAVLAFRKLTGMPRTFVADGGVFRALAAGKGAFHPRFPSHGRHVEASIAHQVVALIAADGTVERIYPTSTGKPSTPTVRGNFRVYSKTPGLNSHGMYYSAYFIRGYAVHGYFDVPTYNASHGCLRVPIPDAPAIYDWVRLGTPVDVYS